MSDYATPVLSVVEGLIRPARCYIYLVAAPSHGALETGFADHILQPQMKPHGRIQIFNIAIGQSSEESGEAFLAHGRQLIGHRLMRPVVYRNDGLTGIHPADIGGQRDNLNSVQMS